jgi:hypothetical protein
MHPVIPSYVAPIVLVVAVGLAFWLYRMVARASESADLAPATRTRVRVVTGLFLGIWLGLAFLFAPTSPVLDADGRGVVPTTFLFFGGVTLTVAVGLLVFSPTWRRVVDAIPADQLISVQLFRVIGAVLFLPLYAIGSLPRHFALPAGWGDLAVGLMAPLVALAVRRSIVSRSSGSSSGARQLALGWNLFGFADLLAAVGLGTGYLLLLLRPEAGAPPPAAAMTFFPLVLIPTFAVPLGFILHVYSIRRSLRGERRSGAKDSRTGIALQELQQSRP